MPDSTAVADVEVGQADVTPTPGANRSKQPPQFENDARASERSEAPTVTASDTLAGEVLQASSFAFPAATTSVAPRDTRLRTASSSAWDRPPPSDMFTTAGAPSRRPAIQSRPLITPETVPDPPQSRTLTGTTVAAFATPNVAPATVAATCVPWPLQSP